MGQRTMLYISSYNEDTKTAQFASHFYQWGIGKATMNKRLLQNLSAKLHFLPSCQDYTDMLSYAHIMTRLSIDELREKMGLATYADWADLLHIA